MSSDTAFTTIPEGAHAEIASVARHLRAFILALRQEIDEWVYGGKKVKMTSYSIGLADNVIAVLSPAATHCNLFCITSIRSGQAI